MNTKILLTSLIVLMLAACGDKQPAAETQAPQVADSIAKASGVVLPVADGVSLPSGFVVRSRSSKPTNAEGMVAQVVRAEFAGMDAAQAKVTLLKAFAKQGFKPVPGDNAEDTSIVRNQSGLRVRFVTVSQGPDLKVDLTSPGAQGLVTFYWKEAGQ